MYLLAVAVAALLAPSQGCRNVSLQNPVETINSHKMCERAADDPSKYTNEADWSFHYDNNCPEPRWINLYYVVDIEKSDGCSLDSLTFGVSSDVRRLVLCGQQSATVSIPLKAGESFLISFKSDYSVGGRGFNFTYIIDERPFFSVNVPRVLDESSSSTTLPTTQPTPAVFETVTGSYVYPEYGTDPPFNHYQYPEYQTYPPFYYRWYLKNPGGNVREPKHVDGNRRRPAYPRNDIFNLRFPAGRAR